jgi:hypothetical protein
MKISTPVVQAAGGAPRHAASGWQSGVTGMLPNDGARVKAA